MKKGTLGKILFVGTLLWASSSSINNHFQENKKRAFQDYQPTQIKVYDPNNYDNYKKRISSCVESFPRQLEIIDFYDRINDKNLCKTDRACLEKFEEDSSAGRRLMLNSELMKGMSWIDSKKLTTRDKICMQVVGEYVRGQGD